MQASYLGLVNTWAVTTTSATSMFLQAFNCFSILFSCTMSSTSTSSSREQNRTTSLRELQVFTHWSTQHLSNFWSRIFAVFLQGLVFIQAQLSGNILLKSSRNLFEHGYFRVHANFFNVIHDRTLKTPQHRALRIHDGEPFSAGLMLEASHLAWSCRGCPLWPSLLWPYLSSSSRSPWQTSNRQPCWPTLSWWSSLLPIWRLTELHLKQLELLT